jgi:ankyrin repeat protein
MKHLLITTIAAVLLVGCATTKQPEPTTAKAPDISIHMAAMGGNIEAVKQHIAAGTDVNANFAGHTPLHWAAKGGMAKFQRNKETIELLINKGADVNANYHGNSEEEYVAGSDRHVILDMWLCDACMCAHNHEK